MKEGSRLNAYEIVGPLGAGGMGEVYRAKDTRLDRTVAIKILPDAVASDPDRRQRFEREARTIASLNHPHVCALHDVGSAAADGRGGVVEYLVMEYLEGETLASKIARGPLPMAEIVRFGSEMAGALDAAHRQRIVHRDLKPSNVMITKTGVKLLDFGLAKATAPSGSSPSVLSTMTVGMTTPGTVLGTLPYMSPEQIEGREADARSDIFALGSVLYEMATGRRAFAGDSPAAVASAVLSSDPPPISTSPSLDRLIRGCLRKDPDERWQSALDVGLQLREVEERDRQGTARPAIAAAPLLPWIVAGIAAAMALAALVMVWRTSKAPIAQGGLASSQMRFAIALGGTDAYLARNVERLAFALSPDGATLAFAGGAGGGVAGPPAVVIRRLSSETLATLPGTEGATSVFWSPDGKSIGFFSQGKLKRVDLNGGAPVPICDVQQSIGQTGTWGDGVIVFGSVQGDQLLRVSPSGGDATPIRQPQRARGEQRIVWPSFLPDGKRFLYLSILDSGKGVIMMGSVDGGEPREILPVRSNAQYAAPGFLMYGFEGALVARRFDLESGTVSGEPIAIADQVTQFTATGLTDFSVSPAGAVVFHQGLNASRIVTTDRVGREVAEIRPAGPYENIRLLSGGRELFVDRTDPKTSRMDIWKIDLSRNSEARLTSEMAAGLQPVIAPDGSMIFSASRNGPPTLILRKPGGAEERLSSAAGMQIGSDISPDGRWISFSQRVGRGNYDLLALSLADRRVVPIQNTDADENQGRFSPDGRHVAFSSDLGGRRDVYVAPFPQPGPARIVSTSPGAAPRWSRDGRELFYIGADGTVFSVSVSAAGEFGPPQALFSRGRRYRWTDFEPTRDGRFIGLEPVSLSAQQPLHIVLNWAR